MTDLVVTPGSVVPGADAQIEHGFLGANGLLAGQSVYKDAAEATNKFKLADADGASALRSFYGILMNGGSIGQPCAVLKKGTYNPGATVAVGKTYVLSDTPGGIMPVDDLDAGDYVTVIGIGITASSLKVSPIVSGVAHP